MVEKISSQYELKAADYLDVAAAHQRYRMKRPVFKLAFLLYLGLMTLLSTLVTASWLIKPESIPHVSEADRWKSVAVVGGLWSILYFARSRNFLNRIHFGQLFRALPDGSRRIEWGFDDFTLWSRTELAESTSRWELFETIVESPKCFLFFHFGGGLALILPEQAFSSANALRRFIETARDRVPRYVVLGEYRRSAKPDPRGLDDEF